MRSISHKHVKFLRISLYQLSLAEKKFAKLSNRTYKLKFINSLKPIKPVQQYLLKRYSNIYKDCSDHIDISISMSAFAIEAFINFYAIHFELDRIPGYNERIPTKQKWEKYPQQKTGTTLPQDALDKVQEVLNDRNDIAHYKPTTDAQTFSGHSLKTAYESVNKVYAIYDELNKIDEHINLPVFKFPIPNHAERMIMDYK